MSEDTMRIYQDFPGEAAEALLSRDAEAFLARILLSLRIETRNEALVVEDLPRSEQR